MFVVTNFVLLLKTFILRWFHFICVEEINFSSEVLQNDVVISKNKISVYEIRAQGTTSHSYWNIPTSKYVLLLLIDFLAKILFNEKKNCEPVQRHDLGLCA